MSQTATGIQFFVLWLQFYMTENDKKESYSDVSARILGCTSLDKGLPTCTNKMQKLKSLRLKKAQILI
jgi:hypothetical protein